MPFRPLGQGVRNLAGRLSSPEPPNWSPRWSGLGWRKDYSVPKNRTRSFSATSVNRTCPKNATTSPPTES